MNRPMIKRKKVARAKVVMPSRVSLTDKEVNASFSGNALKMMRKRYLQTDGRGNQETPAQMFRRIAHELAAIEKKYGHDDRFVKKTEEEFFEIMTRKEYTPAGRTVTNAGGKTRVVANCIVLPILDSMESIFQTLKDAALLQQAGSGLGFDFSHLRPSMTPTKKSNGVASGPVSFLRVYNEAFGVIKQQGRHGANMAMIQVDHPDVLDFIECKKREGDIRNFNISIKMTDEFMKMLIEKPGEQWHCSWNGKKMKPHRVIRAPNGSVKDFEEIHITVQQLFDILVDHAWLNGEPGIVFIDEVNRTNPLPGLGPIDCSNPCVVGETLVPTEEGLLPIAEIASRYGNGNLLIATETRMPEFIAARYVRQGASGAATAAVLQRTRMVPASRFSANPILRAWKSGVKPVYRLETKAGYELTATADHKIMTTEGKVPLGELTAHHCIVLQSKEGLFSTKWELPVKALTVPREYTGKNGRRYVFSFPTNWSRELGQALGWLVGDGWLRDKKGEALVGFTFAAHEKETLTYLKSILNQFYGTERNETVRENGVYHLSYGKPFVDFFGALGVQPVLADEKGVPASLFTAPREAIVGFLQGLFSADGTIGSDESKGSRYVRLTAKSRALLKQVQVLLLNLGIASTLYDRSREPRTTFAGYRTKNGEVHRYESDGILYELQVSKENLPAFLERVGFLPHMHEEKIAALKTHGYYRESFEDEIASVTYVGEREVYDLTEPFTATFIANGIVISNCGEQFLHHYDNCNLGSVNLAVFAKNGEVDWTRLRWVTKVATRLMDNVIDTFDFPVQKVTDLARKNRRIGLGIMGFADMLYQLGIPYNSEAGFNMAERVMKTINDAAHAASQALAREKSPFPNIRFSVYAKQKISMRNAALTTVAPTGSISMMFDCSSGIEPNFALAYVKQDKDGHQYRYFNRHFETALKKHKLNAANINEIKKEVVKTGSIQGLSAIPEALRKNFVVAMDISAKDHMRMQAAFQRKVDNSISKTINFPNSATKDDVAQGFILAWKLKCKSCTVYRDGSRNVQILNLGTGENLTAPNEIPAAPGLLAVPKPTDPPLNLAMDKGKMSPRNRPEVMTGRTYRMKTGYGKLYVTINNDEKGVPFEVFATIGKSGGFFQEQSEGICRLVSLALRSGVKVEEIIDNLKGIRGPMPVMTDKGTVLSLPDAIGQILEEHVKYTEQLFQDAQPANDLVAVKTPVESANRAGDGIDSPIARKSLADFGFMPGCPDCGSQLQMSEGCISCKSCGFSRCL